MKRFLSAILACSLLLGCMPLSVFAQDANQIPEETTAVETPVEPAETTAPPTEAAAKPAETEAATEAASEPAETTTATEAETEPVVETEAQTEPASTEETVPAEAAVKVIFVCEPAEMNLAVYAVNGEEKTLLKAAEEKTYELLPGTYCYTAELDGYAAAEEAFTVKASQEPVRIAVSLVALQDETVPETTEETVPETTEETVPETTEETVEGEFPVEQIDEELKNREPVRTPGDDKSQDELYEKYLEHEFYNAGEGKQDDAYGFACRSDLTASERILYDAARPYISKLAHGTETYCVMEKQVVVSASELGIRSVGSSSNGHFYPSSDLEYILDRGDYNPWSPVVKAIMGDMPYDHYWMDRSYQTGGWITYYPYLISGNASNNTVTLGTKVMIMAAQKYATSQTEYVGGRYCHVYLNTAMTGAGSVAGKAGARAKQIVASVSGKADIDKLIYYADYIMNAVEYDYTAAETGPNASNGSGAWAIINTFDDNPNTNIVCEGYAKSFQYLCDLSSFNGNIEVYQDSGDAVFPNGGGGPHMWNIVNIDGVKLLTDLTPEDPSFFLTPVKILSTNPVYYELTGLSGYKGGKYIPANENNVPTSLTLNLPAPKANAKAVTSLSPSGYNVNIKWSPALSNGMFKPGVEYTATVFVTPTVNPIFSDFKLVVGGKTLSTELTARGITRAATIKFPSTGAPAVGWYSENGHWRYYFKDGSYAKNQWLDLGNWFHFDSNGYMQIGWQYIDKGWFYFNESGHMLSGWQYIGDNWFYLAGGRMTIGWAEIDGNWFYFDDAGHMLTNFQKIGDNWFYFDGSGHMVTGWLTVGGYRYCFNSSGHMLTGIHKIGTYSFFFDASGHMRTGWQTVNGKRYCFDTKGHMLIGMHKLGSYYYCFGPSGDMLTGFQKIGGKTFCFNNRGHMLTGWQVISNRWYYFGTGGQMATGWRTISGNRYCFDNRGHMLTGFQKIGSYKYYFNKEGHMLTGWQNIGNFRYCFNNKGQMLVGWVKMGSYWYHFDEWGHMAKGWKNLDGHRFCFDNKGHMLIGWVKMGSYWYYFNESGYMAKGWHTIDGRRYFFDESGHMTISK